jgi:hypothetical protein
MTKQVLKNSDSLEVLFRFFIAQRSQAVGFLFSAPRLKKTGNAEEETPALHKF